LSKQHMSYIGEEKFLMMDWKKMQTEERYDIVLGDLVVNMLNTADRDSLLKNVSEILAKDGVSILRNWIKLDNQPSDFISTVKLVREKYPHVNFYTATAGFAYTAYIDDTEFTDVQKLKRDLENLVAEKLVSDKEYEYWRDRLKFEVKGISAPAMDSLNEQLSKYFKIDSIKEGIDIFSDKFKIHFLRKIK